MIEADLYFTYWVARQIHQALNGVRLPHPDRLPVMFQGKEALETFIGSFKTTFLPKSKGKAKIVLDDLVRLMPKVAIITTEEFAQLYAYVSEFEVQLQEECKHLYTLTLEDHRVLSAYVLVERIENAISENTWKYMSKLARREIEESGVCLAVERYTASGFHILRSVEAVIREYIEATGVILSVSERNWGKYVTTLKEQSAADAVVSIIDNMRRDDRNTLMHPEKFLEMDEAIGLFFLSQTALDRLISDMEKRGFAKPYPPVTAL